MAKLICGCADKGCKAAHGSECTLKATQTLYRADMDVYVSFCDVCAEDALESGVFADASDEDDQDEEEDEDTLRSTVDTREIGQAVLSEARETLERDNLTAFFEHGQWWITDTETGAQWSVVDCESQTGEEYFDFEQVTQGDED